MTNPYDPPKKLALGDADLAEALELAGQGENGALDAMAILEEQSKQRAEDATAYVAWVRSMEADGSAEAKAALVQARRNSSGLSIEPAEASPVSESTEDSWKTLVPDWDERQEQIAEAKERAIADAVAMAKEQAEREIESAVADAVAAAEFEAELRREEAVAAAKAEAERIEAERLEQERLRSEELAEQQRLEELERERVEAERVEAERVEVEQQENIRLEIENAERAAAEALELAELEAMERAEAAEKLRLEAEQAQAEEIFVQGETIDSEIVDEIPEPVRASDFATGSFDIVESVEQAATEEFDEGNFEVLLEDGELGFARDPKSVSKEHSISTIERRAKPISQLYVWSSLSVGVAPILLAYLSLAFKLTALDRIVAFAIAFGLSALLITAVAIGGKRSGLSTLFLSRAAFGVTGNFVPAIAQVLAKLTIGSALMVAAVALFSGNIVGMPKFDENFASIGSIEVPWLFAIAGVFLVVGSVIALLGGKVLYWAQFAVAAIGALVVLLFITFTVGALDLGSNEWAFSGNWLSFVSLIVLVFAGFAALWVNSVADFTRKIAMAQSGKAVALFVSLATGVLPFLIASFSVLVSASLSANFRLAAQFNPFGAIFEIVPGWLASLLLVSAALTLLAWAASWLYSSSVGLAALSIKLRRFVSQPIVLLLALGGVMAIIQIESASEDISSSLIVIASVFVLSWAGIFASDIALRRIAYHEVSLTRDYGFYRAFNPTNVAGFVLAAILGLGFVSSASTQFSWLGFIAKPIGAGELAMTNIGTLFALFFAALFPILFGRGRIKGQEAEVLKIEARKSDLDGVNFGEAI